MAEARIPNMRGIMAARTKPLKVVEPVAIEALTSVAGFGVPPAKAGVKLVDAENVEELMAQPDIDVALVGGASLKPESFAALVTSAK